MIHPVSAGSASTRPWLMRSCWSSPLSNISDTMSAPPTNSPLTYNCGMVGQSENSLMPSLMAMDERTSTETNSRPSVLRMATTDAEKPHCGVDGVPFMKRTTLCSLTMSSMTSLMGLLISRLVVLGASAFEGSLRYSSTLSTKLLSPSPSHSTSKSLLTTQANLLALRPISALEASSSIPDARVNSAFPSDIIMTRPSTPALLDHALRTNGSLTARQATTSTPNDLISSTFSKKPGRCFSEQVGVNAPGTAKRTLLFPRKMSSIITSASSGSVLTRADGMGLPLLSFIRSRLRWWWWWCL
mmetsp:Transcript_8437/g.20671  ORF Transcript_8437/g.20671 Transcript_8437/m.20671 type:complete len:300 (-) Transcript_8437:219-1118(-)